MSVNHEWMERIFLAAEWCSVVKHKPRDRWELGAPSNQSVSSVQSFSCVQLFVAHWTVARHASLSITNSQSLLKLMSIESVMPSNLLTLCRPLLLLPPIPPSIRVFFNESVLCIRWPKYWRFSVSISLSNEHPGLISFRMDWLDLLAVQGSSPTPQFRSINSSCSAALARILEWVAISFSKGSSQSRN